MASQSFTFFFTTDVHRATDKSQADTWTAPAQSCSGPVQVRWVNPKPS